MLRERGLSPQTIVSRCRAIHRFFAVIDKADLRLDQLTVAQLDELLARMIRDDRYARTTIQTLVSAPPAVLPVRGTAWMVPLGIGRRDHGAAAVSARRPADRPLLGRREAIARRCRRGSSPRTSAIVPC